MLSLHSILYLIYIIIGLVITVSLVKLRALSAERLPLDVSKIKLTWILASLIALILSIRLTPTYLSMDFSKSFILVGGDQAFDYALTKYIIARGQLPQLNVTAPRLIEYSFYPSIHLWGSQYAVIISHNMGPVVVLVLLEQLFLYIVFLKLLKSYYYAFLLTAILSTNGYFSIFHINYVREVYFLTISFFLLVVLLLANEKFLFRQHVIAITLMLITLPMTHFYGRYAWLLVLWSSTLLLVKHNSQSYTLWRKIAKTLIVLSFTSCVTYDIYIAVGYISSLEPKHIAEEIVKLYYSILSYDEDPINVIQYVGIKLPEVDRFGILANQVVPFATLLIILMTRPVTRNSLRKKRILASLVTLMLYYMLLMSKMSNNLYIVNLGLRGSQYILILFFIAISTLHLEKISNLNNDFKHIRVNRFFNVLTLLLLIISVTTFPSLLSPMIKGLEPTYAIPYITGKVLTSMDILKNETVKICVFVEGIGRPESELFRGFVYGLLPERPFVVVKRIYSIEHDLRRNLCYFVFIDNRVILEVLKASKILDAQTYALFLD